VIASLDLAALEEARGEYLRQVLGGTRRTAVPIREAFLQIRGKRPEPGVLSDFVKDQSEHALDLYLLILAATPAPPYRLFLNTDFWATLLRRDDQSRRNARLALRRSVSALVSLDLIVNETRLGVPLVQLLDESGSCELYHHPGKKGDRYITLPHSYWQEGLDRRLSLRAKAVLLIARSLRPEGFTLPLAHSREWYGLSADTLRRGMDELVKARLVRYTSADVPAPSAPHGTSVRRTYVLAGSMARTKPPPGRRPPSAPAA
jgi:hypothetical protein